MKRTLTALLVWSFLTLTPIAKHNANAQTAPVVFVIAVVACGCMATVYIMHQGQTKMRYFVLEKGYLDGTWTPVVTNYAHITPGNAWPLFQVYMTDSLATYKVREISKPSNWKGPQYVFGAKENPVIQTQ